MFAKAGVKRCYGIVGGALNPVIDALHRNGKIDFVHVHHEEYGVFAAVADAYFTGKLLQAEEKLDSLQGTAFRPSVTS